MTHILLIDDEVKITTSLKASFERNNYQISIANDGHSGLSMAMTQHPDVIILDVMMPGLDGWEVCQTIRQHSTVPIIMLTALDDTMDRIRGLELGADDYLVKPFGFKELEAHVKAMLRRVQFDQGTAHPTRFIVGDIALDTSSHLVTKRGDILTLRHKEYEILVLLMCNLGKVITRNQLFDDIWGTDWLGDTRTLDVHMSWLRRKLEDNPAKPLYLQTVRGVGYRFVNPEDEGN